MAYGKLIDQARELATKNGTKIKDEYEYLCRQRDKEIREEAKRRAPRAELNKDGTYKQLSSDYRWPFGVDSDGIPVAPYGIGKSRYPRKAPEGSKRKKLPTSPTNVRESLIEKLERLRCDPIEGIAKIALNERTSTSDRLRAFSELASYIYPKKRSVEHKGDGVSQRVFVIAVPEGSRVSSPEEWLSTVRDVTPTRPAIDHEDRSSEREDE